MCLVSVCFLWQGHHGTSKSPSNNNKWYDVAHTHTHTHTHTVVGKHRVKGKRPRHVSENFSDYTCWMP